LNGGKDTVVTGKHVDAVAAADGLKINGQLFDGKLPLERYQNVLGPPSRTIDAGPPAPFGHRNNQVHVFDSEGIYLTEHHASRMIESVNFIFDTGESPFPIERSFDGNLEVDGHTIRAGKSERDIESAHFTLDLPGEFSVKYETCWIGISAQGRRDAQGKRRKPRFIIRVSVSF
jgi:hypothetical protein